MAEIEGSDELGLAVLILRRIVLGGEQRRLAAASGVRQGRISEIERGLTTPGLRTLGRLTAAMGLPPSAVDETVAFIRAMRSAARRSGAGVAAGRRTGTGAPPAGAAAVFAGGLDDLLARALGLPEGAPREPSDEAAPERAREEAARLWARLDRYSARERTAIVEEAQEFQRWALAARVCDESVRVAGDDAKRAGELAELGLAIAGLLGGPASFRARVEGYAWAHLGNARQVGGDLPGAKEAFSRAASLWRAGADDEGRLPEARVLALEATWRKDQREPAAALALLERAAAADAGAGGGEAGALLLLRARVLEALDDYQGSIAALRRLAASLDEAAEPRMLFAVRFNLAVNLLHLGAAEEAGALAGEARRLAIGLGNQLDLVRVRWLEGRVAAGLGRWQESAAALQEVVAAFTAGGHALDSALAMLELAAVCAEQGRSREAGELARQAASLCKAQGVRRETLAAIELVRRAAAEERLSAELAWRVARFFERARRAPGLRFEAGK
jgi:transcriptional regulator with XRE-family HTH domain